MKSLYEKTELGFSLLWIGLYVILFSLADGLSQMLSTEKLITAPASVVLTAAVFLWLRKNGLLKKYGFCKPSGKGKAYLYFLPLVLLATCNFWNGLTAKYTFVETVLFIVSMLCVGFLEEVIFRGFLFKVLCKDNVKQAIIISSITFGIGHIVNLLGGAPFLATGLQIVYAVAVGFAFTALFYKSGSLIPCIITHSVVNATSAFCPEGSAATEVASAAVITVIAVAYGLYILRKNKE